MITQYQVTEKYRRLLERNPPIFLSSSLSLSLSVFEIGITMLLRLVSNSQAQATLLLHLASLVAGTTGNDARLASILS